MLAANRIAVLAATLLLLAPAHADGAAAAAGAPAKPAAAKLAAPESHGPDSTFVVITSGDPTMGALSIETQHVLETHLSKVKKLTRFDPAPVLLGPDGNAAKSELSAGRASFTDGKKAYENLDLDGAATAFQDATTHLVKGLPAMEDPTPLVRAFVFLGATDFLAGKRDAAQQAFTRALLVDPDFKPNTAIFSPPIVQAYEGAKWEISAQPKGTLSVVSHPAHALVWIDGRFHGVAPVTLEKLPIGPHFVVTRMRGYLPRVSEAEVTAADPVTVKADLAPGSGIGAYKELASAATGSAGPQKMPQAARRLATAFRARRLVLGRVTLGPKGATITVTAYEVKHGLRVAAGSVLVDPAASSRHRAIAGFADRFLPKAASAPILPKVVPPKPRIALTKQWWFWAATGAAVVLAGTAVGLAAAPGGPDRSQGLVILGIP